MGLEVSPMSGSRSISTELKNGCFPWEHVFFCCAPVFNRLYLVVSNADETGCIGRVMKSSLKIISMDIRFSENH